MKSPKHIVFLTRLYYPHIGGVEKHVYEISKILSAKGYSITIITEEIEKAEKNFFDYNIKNVTFKRIPVGENDWLKKFRIWKWMWKHKELFLQAEIIHCHDVFFWYLPFALLFPMKNVYTTFHGYESYPLSKKAILYRKIFEYMSNKTLCVGDFMKKWYHAKPYKIIYGGVNMSPNNTKRVKHSAIFYNRLDEHTGIQTYIEATRIIRKEIKDFTLTVYGDGPLQHLVIGEGIIHKPYDPFIEKQIGKYEVAFVSRYLAILEAFSNKMPVFSVYDNPVKEDYLIMTPYADSLFLADNPSDLANQVIAYLKAPENYKTKINREYEFALKNSWEDVTSVYLSLWGISEKEK